MKKVNFNSSLDFVVYDPLTGRMLVEGIPVTYHCNVFNHFFAEGIKLALGEGKGKEIIYRSSEIAHYRLFRRIKERYGLSDKEIYTFGMNYFKSRGLGVLNVEGRDKIYLLASTHAHTYLKVLRSFSSVPICDVERGFVAGLLEAALDVEPGTIHVEETSCIGSGDPICKMEVRITHDRIDTPNPDYSKVVFYPVDGAEKRKNTMEKIMPLIPEPDDSGIIAIDSAFTDIKKVWISQLPGEYYAYANMKVADISDPETARYTLTLAGFNCVLFTYVSIARSPIGNILLEDAESQKDYFVKLAEIGNYLGFGIFKVEDVHENEGCECDIRLYNFYENSYLVALNRETVSYFLLGATLAQSLATYFYRYYERDSLGPVKKIFEEFDKAYESMDVDMSFDSLKNEQRVILSLPVQKERPPSSL